MAKVARVIFFTLIFLALINSVFSFSMIGTPKDSFTVIPEKEYSGEVCITSGIGQLYSFEPEYNDSIFKEFFIQEIVNVTSYNKKKYNRDVFCNEYTFVTGNYTSSKDKSPSASINVYPYDPNHPSIRVGYGYKIYLDAESVTYRHALLNLSKKFFLVFTSIFTMLALVLYILNKNKSNE